jgi:uncharacterized protein YjbJ (UPF0337 family)
LGLGRKLLRERSVREFLQFIYESPKLSSHMNKQEIKGEKEKSEGKLRREAGKITGNRKEQVKGKAEELKGSVREAVGRTARKIDQE